MPTALWLALVLLGPQAADADLRRRVDALDSQHVDARIAVLEATVADLKKTTREDTLWIRGIIAAGVGVTGVGITQLRRKRPTATP